MKFPVSLQVGTWSVPLHLIFEVLAFFIAFRYYLFLRKTQGDIISAENRSWIVIAATFGALTGSRLIGGLEHPELLNGTAEHIFFHFYQNKTVLGGFLGGLLGVELVKKLMGEKNASGDLFAFPMIAGLIIGRLGCFCNGIYEDTYGIPTTLFTGMDLGDGILRHPVTLYEILFLVLLWVLLCWLKKLQLFNHGALFKIFLFSYCLFRFLCDYIKPHYGVIFGLSTIQLTSLGGMLWYYRYLIHPGKLFIKVNYYHAS